MVELDYRIFIVIIGIDNPIYYEEHLKLRIV